MTLEDTVAILLTYLFQCDFLGLWWVIFSILVQCSSTQFA